MHTFEKDSNVLGFLNFEVYYITIEYGPHYKNISYEMQLSPSPSQALEQVSSALNNSEVCKQWYVQKQSRLVWIWLQTLENWFSYEVAHAV